MKTTNDDCVGIRGNTVQYKQLARCTQSTQCCSAWPQPRTCMRVPDSCSIFCACFISFTQNFTPDILWYNNHILDTWHGHTFACFLILSSSHGQGWLVQGLLCHTVLLCETAYPSLHVIGNSLYVCLVNSRGFQSPGSGRPYISQHICSNPGAIGIMQILQGVANVR